MAEQGSESVHLTASLIISSDVLYDLCCDVCSEDGQNYEADGFCVDCGEYLCKDCVKGHKKNRLSRDHTVQDKTQMPRQKPPVARKMAKGVCIENCDNHPTRLVEYYCRDDKTLGCSVCMTMNHRMCEGVDHIPDMCENLLDSRQYKQFTNALTMLKTKSQYVTKRSKENVAKAEKCATDAADAMNTLRKQMNKAFDKFEEGLRMKAEEMKHADIKKMKDVVGMGDNVYDEVEKITANLQSLQNKNQLGQLFIQMIKLEETVKKLIKLLANADADNNVIAYTFEPTQKVQEILDDPSFFGMLSVDHSSGACPDQKSADVKSSAAASDTGDESCVICMDKITAPRTLDCGHSFCTDCIKHSLSYKKTCPTCGVAVCGAVTGNQPQGTMHVYSDRNLYCSGYENYGQIKITYIFPNGIQQKCHPNPGAYYQGISRSAFLPDNRQGNIILQMLGVAFSRKLVFTIGSSRITGEEGVITWNDIHHKTNQSPHGKFGYPDPTYLQLVTEELQAKGVTEKDIPAKKMEEINACFMEDAELRWKTSQRRKYHRH